jgi:hypothetical protein
MEDQNDRESTPPPPRDDSIFSKGTRECYGEQILSAGLIEKVVLR